MGLVQSIGNFLGGRPAGYDDAWKNNVDRTLSDYDSAMNDAVGPGAYNRSIAQYNEGLSNAIGNMDASGYGHLRTTGFADPSMGTGLHGLTYALAGAQNAQTVRNNILANRRGWIAGRANLLGSFKDRWYHQSRPGLGQALGGLAAAYAQKQLGFGGTAQSASGSGGGLASVYGPATQTPDGAEVPYNYEEG